MTAQKILIHTHTYTATYVRRVEFLSLYSRSLSRLSQIRKQTKIYSSKWKLIFEQFFEYCQRNNTKIAVDDLI